MSDTVLDRFFAIEREKYGKADYHFKPEPVVSRIRAFYARPFCPTYIQNFSTSMYPDTFFASKKKGNPQSCVETEFHENVHKWDRWKQGIKFTLKYTFPHWLLLPFLLAVVVLSRWQSWLVFGGFLALFHIGLTILARSAARDKAGMPHKIAQVFFYAITGVGFLTLLASTIYFGRWWAFLWLGVVLFASPWPLKPWWRRDAELRGYTMSLYRLWLKYRDQLNQEWWRQTIARYAKTFSGPNYFFMERDEDYVQKEFQFQVDRFTDTEDQFLARWAWCRKRGWSSEEQAEPFRMASKFMKQEGMVHGS